MNQREFQENIVQWKAQGNLYTKRIPNQLRPIYEEMISQGEQPFSLVPMTLLINSNIRAQQAAEVFFVPQDIAFNKDSYKRWKQF